MLRIPRLVVTTAAGGNRKAKGDYGLIGDTHTATLAPTDPPRSVRNRPDARRSGSLLFFELFEPARRNRFDCIELDVEPLQRRSIHCDDAAATTRRADGG